MQKVYQIFSITIPAKKTFSFFDALRSDMKSVAGLFFYGKTADLTNLTVGIKINNTEILPTGSDVALFAFNGNYSRNETMWNTQDGAVEANGKSIEAVFENNSDNEIALQIYCLLKNSEERLNG